MMKKAIAGGRLNYKFLLILSSGSHYPLFYNGVSDVFIKYVTVTKYDICKKY